MNAGGSAAPTWAAVALSRCPMCVGAAATSARMLPQSVPNARNRGRINRSSVRNVADGRKTAGREWSDPVRTSSFPDADPTGRFSLGKSGGARLSDPPRARSSLGSRGQNRNATVRGQSRNVTVRGPSLSATVHGQNRNATVRGQNRNATVREPNRSANARGRNPALAEKPPPQRAGPLGNRSYDAGGHNTVQPCNLLTRLSVVHHGRAR